eukprot:6949737-Pyramimonas_sp.AAC.1
MFGAWSENEPDGADFELDRCLTHYYTTRGVDQGLRTHITTGMVDTKTNNPILKLKAAKAKA